MFLKFCKFFLIKNHFTNFCKRNYENNFIKNFNFYDCVVLKLPVNLCPRAILRKRHPPLKYK
jgi:hypothetical protein